MTNADVAAARTGKAHLKVDKIGAKVARAADRIREVLIQDELPPGSPIRERALASSLEISRTPLRGAKGQVAVSRTLEPGTPDTDQRSRLCETANTFMTLLRPRLSQWRADHETTA